MTTPKPKHYVDGERLCELAAEAAASGEFADELVSMFYSIAKNRCRRFTEITDKQILGMLDADDLIQEAVMLCVQKTANFDPTKLQRKSYAFYFFRMIVDQGYIRIYEHSTRQKRKPVKRLLSLDRYMELLKTDWAIEDSFELEDNLRQVDGAAHSGRIAQSVNRALAEDDNTLTSDLILDMRHQHEQGMTYADLADEYSIEIEVVEELILRGQA